MNIKKSGFNAFNKFRYYELSDFVPQLIQLCDKLGLFIAFDFTTTEGKLTIINIDKPDEIVNYTVPMIFNEIKGCNAVQNLGGSITYLKRYLLMNAFDIVENDLFDSETTYDCGICSKQIKNITRDMVNSVEKDFGILLCKECRLKRRAIIG